MDLMSGICSEHSGESTEFKFGSGKCADTFKRSYVMARTSS